MDLRIFYAAAVLPHASVPATVSQRLLGGMINASLVCAVCALVPLPPAGRVGAGAGVILVCVVSQALTGAGPGGAVCGTRLRRTAPPSGPPGRAALKRAGLLLIQAYAERFRPDPDRDAPALAGSAVLMTSGQGLGPMPREIAYCTAKAALAGITPSLAAGLAERGIRLNTVNPGPVDTGYMDAPTLRAVDAMFPSGRTARPQDPARLICWLLTDDASWVTGQVISTEGGFRR